MTSDIRILYAEDNPQDADQTRVHLVDSGVGFVVEIVETGQQCLERLTRGGLDLLLLDHRLPDMDGLEVLIALVRRELQIPVVMVTGVGDEELVIKALRLGAVDYLPKTSDYLDRLPALLSEVLADHQRKRRQGLLSSPARRILYVEHGTADIDLTREHFAEHAPHLVLEPALTCQSALERLAQAPGYDLVLVDLRMPDMSALDFVRKARQLGLALPPFVVISGKGDDAAAIATLKLGAAEYISKRDGYLNQITHVIEHAIAHAQLQRSNQQLQVELEERQQAERALRASEGSLKRAQKIAGLGAWQWEIQQGLVEWSDEFFLLLGCTPGEISPSMGAFIAQVHPQDQEPLQAALDLALEGIPNGVDFRICCPGDELRWLHQQTELVRDAADQPLRLYGTVLDITTRKDVELKLKAYQEHLEELVEQRSAELQVANETLLRREKLAVLGELAGGIGHELRNPLTSIANSVYCLRLALPGADEEVRRFLEIISEEVSASEKIIADLLSLLKIKAAHLAPQATDRIIEKTLERVPPPDNIRLQLQVPTPAPQVIADFQQVQQVLSNLVVNAYQAMEAGGDLTITVEAAAGKVRIKVADTGIGIPPENVARLFQPLFSTRASGIGLGLAVSQKMAEANAGVIMAESEAGVGSVFTLILPAGGDR